MRVCSARWGTSVVFTLNWSGNVVGELAVGLGGANQFTLADFRRRTHGGGRGEEKCTHCMEHDILLTAPGLYVYDVNCEVQAQLVRMVADQRPLSCPYATGHRDLYSALQTEHRGCRCRMRRTMATNFGRAYFNHPKRSRNATCDFSANILNAYMYTYCSRLPQLPRRGC
jgi:hypothetical protein